MKTFKKIANDERGQALLIVLALLMLGGLTITPCLSYAGTSLKNSTLIKNNVMGIYAAEAGIEDAIWSLEHHQTPSTQLTNDINGMTVTMSTEDHGDYTLYFGTLVETEGHSNYLRVQGDIIWDAAEEAYKYTITVTKQNTPSTIYITGVGARLPEGYTYQPGSANDFSGNLSQNEPEIAYDSTDAQMVNWTFLKVSVNPTKTETFYITGAGDLEDDYTWVAANRTDIGEVGEITGTLSTITATATDPADNRIAAQITAQVMLVGAPTKIVSWNISR
jgi:hypothetical protein